MRIILNKIWYPNEIINYQVRGCQGQNVVLESSLSDVMPGQAFLVLHPKSVFDEPEQEVNEY